MYLLVCVCTMECQLYGPSSITHKRDTGVAEVNGLIQLEFFSFLCTNGTNWARICHKFHEQQMLFPVVEEEIFIGLKMLNLKGRDFFFKFVEFNKNFPKVHLKSELKFQQRRPVKTVNEGLLSNPSRKP